MKIAISALAILGALAGCVMPANQPQNKLQMTSLEIQAIQSQTFEADKRVTFNSVMSVLQDQGYIIGSASLDTGFITAESPTRHIESGPQVDLTTPMMTQILNGIFNADKRTAAVSVEEKKVVTATVEELGPKRTRVRLNFVHRKNMSGSLGQRENQDMPIVNSKVYEDAFSKIGNAIFIRRAQAEPSPTQKPAK
ncbi:hypothetical protein AOC19_05415 [Polynucleobacter asymbioticus]|uniref:hypothetical protein n=1 Tax=Polynucleobacter asymbioticus TaxID=576611 RepID=UPI001BFD64A4|nr:hypothetical protein [Polynucleobacter asymbioticus]QWD84611.1 hypothetical protein AOC19_05415 [Polynucleobacter asymbioticus]